MHPVPHVLVRAMMPNRSRYYRPRAMSLENPKLLEALTIYEKFKRIDCECDEECPGRYQNSASCEDVVNNTDLYSSNNACHYHNLTEKDTTFLPTLNSFSPKFHPNSKNATEDDTQHEDETSESSCSGPSRYREVNLQEGNYLYFSATTGLVQSKCLEGLCEEEQEMDYTQLLLSKKYWLDVVSPTEKDLELLGSAFRVNEMTLKDIRNGSVDEKMEMFGHYTFISLRFLKEEESESEHFKHKERKDLNDEVDNDHDKLKKRNKCHKDKPFCCMKRNDTMNSSSSSSTPTDEELQHLCINMDNNNSSIRSKKSVRRTVSEIHYDQSVEYEDISGGELNVLLFSDFVITIHKKPWENVKDILGFLSILFDFGGQTPTLPEWVLFSVFVELNQTAKKRLRRITPKVMRIRGHLVNAKEASEMDLEKLSIVLKNNIQEEFELQKISRFIKPKLQVLRTIQLTGKNRLPNYPGVIRFLLNIAGEMDELLDEVDNLTLILERSQDTFLALASVQQSVEANEMGYVMKRISEIAMIFLPLQAVAGFLGMNVMVPYQEEGSTFAFWTVVIGCVIAMIGIFLLKSLFLRGRRNKIQQFLWNHPLSNYCGIKKE